MPGNMIPPSNIPGGRYAASDDRTRPGQVLYATDDEPQIVARGIIVTGDIAGPVLEGGINVRSVAYLGTNVVVTLEYPQPGADYLVLCTQEFVPAPPRHIQVRLKTTTDFQLEVVSEAGVVSILEEEERRLAFIVTKRVV
jgi:hypothetical protein